MGITDNIQDNMGDMGDEAKQRMHELQSKHEAGELDDTGRAELQQLKSRFGDRGTE